MKYLAVTAPRWANAQHTAIECIVNFVGLGEIPFTASPDDEYPHAVEIFTRASQGEFGAVLAYIPPPAPDHATLVAATQAQARAMRLDIFNVLDGLQASAIVTGAEVTVLVNGVPTPVPLKQAIETCKQQLRDLIQQVDLSACTTRAEMEAAVLNAYYAIAQAAPAEIQSAFQSLVP